MRNYSRASCILALAAPLLALTVACVSQGTSHHHLTCERFLPRPATYPIMVTEGDCTRPFKVIAEVTSRPYELRIVDVAGKSDLERLARELGGDGVIRVARNDVTREDFGIQLGGVFRLGTRFVEESTLTGLVVRFTDQTLEGNP